MCIYMYVAQEEISLNFNVICINLCSATLSPRNEIATFSLQPAQPGTVYLTYPISNVECDSRSSGNPPNVSHPGNVFDLFRQFVWLRWIDTKIKILKDLQYYITLPPATSHSVSLSITLIPMPKPHQTIHSSL